MSNASVSEVLSNIENMTKEEFQKLLDKTPPFSTKDLGNRSFIKEYNLKYAYLTGAMYKGIASVEMIIAMGKAGLLGFFGTGGMRLPVIEESILKIKQALSNGEAYGMNLLCNLVKPEVEDSTVDLFFKHGVHHVEAAAYTQVTASLVRYRLKGATQNSDGSINTPNKIMAKISRPEVALQFLNPAPEKIVQKLLEAGKISALEAGLSQKIPMCDSLCVECDSGGHTDNGMPYALVPTMIRLRDDVMKKMNYPKFIYVGTAGGIGTPEAVAASFLMGADFILTGSINQCSPQAGNSDMVKDMLAEANIQDCEMAPAGDMFEIGAKVQVFRKGVFFPARANKLYELYKQYNSIEEIDAKTLEQIQNKYFKRSIAEVWAETQAYYAKEAPDALAKAQQNPKQKMALIFRWYFINSTRLAMKGTVEGKVDFQVHTGPAMGAFNQWVKGSQFENWRNRNVDTLADLLMNGAVKILKIRYLQMQGVNIPAEFLSIKPE